MLKILRIAKNLALLAQKHYIILQNILRKQFAIIKI